RSAEKSSVRREGKWHCEKVRHWRSCKSWESGSRTRSGVFEPKTPENLFRSGFPDCPNQCVIAVGGQCRKTDLPNEQVVGTTPEHRFPRHAYCCRDAGSHSKEC